MSRRRFILVHGIVLAFSATIYVTERAWPLGSYYDFPVILIVISSSSVAVTLTGSLALRFGRSATLMYLLIFPVLWFLVAGLVLKSIESMYITYRPDFSIDVSVAFLAISYFGVWLAWLASLLIVGYAVFWSHASEQHN
jgi:hypothetical protein